MPRPSLVNFVLLLLIACGSSEGGTADAPDARHDAAQGDTGEGDADMGDTGEGDTGEGDTGDMHEADMGEGLPQGADCVVGGAACADDLACSSDPTSREGWPNSPGGGPFAENSSIGEDEGTCNAEISWAFERAGQVTEETPRLPVPRDDFCTEEGTIPNAYSVYRVTNEDSVQLVVQIVEDERSRALNVFAYDRFDPTRPLSNGCERLISSSSTEVDTAGIPIEPGESVDLVVFWSEGYFKLYFYESNFAPSARLSVTEL